MRNQELRYPRDWIEAKLLVNNFEKEIKAIQDTRPKGRQRSKELLKILKILYAILESLDVAIAKSNPDQIIKLFLAKKVLLNWMRRHKFIGEGYEK